MGVEQIITVQRAQSGMARRTLYLAWHLLGRVLVNVCGAIAGPVVFGDIYADGVAYHATLYC